MNSTNPIDYAITFVGFFIAGALSTIAMQQWTKYIRNKTLNTGH